MSFLIKNHEKLNVYYLLLFKKKKKKCLLSLKQSRTHAFNPCLVKGLAAI